MQMTGTAALHLIEAMNEAVDAAGSGEMRGIKALMKLRAMGVEAIVSAPVAPAPRAIDEVG